MASKKESRAPLISALRELTEDAEWELRIEKQEAGHKKTLPRESLGDDLDLEQLVKIKLQQESDIEALLECPLLRLPRDPPLLLGLAVEEQQHTAAANARTLEFYKRKVAELREEKKKYEALVRKATNVSEALDRVQQSRLTEQEKIKAVEKRYNRTTELFQAMRAELRFLLSQFYPDDYSVESMEHLMDTLVTKMMTEPNNPYLVIDDTVQEEHVTFLLRANLITRHQTDFSRIRFIDPRA